MRNAPYAGGGHFVTCIPLQVALPLVAIKSFMPTNGRERGEAGIPITK
jgi:hypothetical protein